MINRVLLPLLLMMIGGLVLVCAAMSDNKVSAFYAWGALILTAMVMNFDVKRKRR